MSIAPVFSALPRFGQQDSSAYADRVQALDKFIRSFPTQLPMVHQKSTPYERCESLFKIADTLADWQHELGKTVDFPNRDAKQAALTALMPAIEQKWTGLVHGLDAREAFKFYKSYEYALPPSMATIVRARVLRSNQALDIIRGDLLSRLNQPFEEFKQAVQKHNSPKKMREIKAFAEQYRRLYELDQTVQRISDAGQKQRWKDAYKPLLEQSKIRWTMMMGQCSENELQSLVHQLTNTYQHTPLYNELFIKSGLKPAR